MKRIIFMVVALLIAGTSGAQEANKYDIKSGIVTMDMVMLIGKTRIKTQRIVYFDDYGLKEREETYSDGKLDGVLLSDGKEKITLDLKRKKAIKMGQTHNGVSMPVDINFMGTKKDIEAGVVKKMPPMTVAGQSCEVIQVTRKDKTDIYAGWHKVMVYLKTGGMVATELKATKLEADVAIPKDKFQIPAGFTVQ